MKGKMFWRLYEPASHTLTKNGVTWLVVVLVVSSIIAVSYNNSNKFSSMNRYDVVFVLIERDSTLVDSMYGMIDREWVRKQLNEYR
jgi:hypothetical protein